MNAPTILVEEYEQLELREGYSGLSIPATTVDQRKGKFVRRSLHVSRRLAVAALLLALPVLSVRPRKYRDFGKLRWDRVYHEPVQVYRGPQMSTIPFGRRCFANRGGTQKWQNGSSDQRRERQRALCGE